MAVADEAKIQRKVQAVIDGHGTDFDILKFSAMTVDQYRQGEPTFDDPVTVRGRGIRRPTADQYTFIGDGEEVEIAWVVSRLELLEKFPLAEEPYWVTNEDRVGFEGKLYSILRTHPTGKVKDTYSMLVILGATLPGNAEAAYP